MSQTGQNFFKKSTTFFLILGLFSFYALSIITMEQADGLPHSSAASCAVMPGGMGKPVPASDSDCLNFHLGVLHSLSESFSGSLGLRFAAVAFLFVLTFSVANLAELLLHFYGRLRVRYRRLYEKTVLAFLVQLGFWLTLFEKRDPAYAFAIA